MPSLQHRLQILSRLPRRLRDASIIDALDAADPEEADAIVSLIADLASEPSADTLLRAAARAWKRLSDDARRTWIAIAAEHATTHIRALAASDRSVDRLAAASISADLLTARLGIRAAAEHPLLLEALRSVASTAKSWQRPMLDAIAHAAHQNTAGRDGLDDTLAEIAARYEEHRHAGAIAAILARAHNATGKLADWLDRAEEPGHLALRAAARRLEPDMPPRRAIELLDVPALAPIALDRITHFEAPAEREQLLALAHLAQRPDRRARLERIHRPYALLPTDAQLASMSSDARRGFLRWLHILPIPDPQRLIRTAPRLTDPDPFVRAAAVRLLAQLPASAELDDALFDFALDPLADVAAAAVDALASTPSAHRRAALADRFAILLRSPHPRVRNIARQAIDACSIFASPDERRAWNDPIPFRRMLRLNREAALADLDEQIRSGPRPLAIQALTIAERAQITNDLHDTIIDATRSDDAFVAAKAVRCLHRLDTPQATSAMHGALKHDDPRVRAEAVELSARAAHTHTITDLEPHLTDPTPRVRANAVHAMLRSSARSAEARTILAEMLGSPDPALRASALWLAEKHATPDLADRLAHLVRTESDPRLRERARRSARILLTRMRRGWSDAHHPPAAAVA